jgi:predicted AlkP superfamily phosphohydrolase/phosphomutase
VGIDGASPRVVQKLTSEGRMPHLARIASEGASGSLRSSKPISSPRIWNSIVTGKVPEKHGILDFARSDGRGGHYLFTAIDRRARPLWSIASAEGMTVGVVNFWNTYPLERVNGVMVSDHLLAKEIDGRERMTNAAKTDIGSVIYPESWNAELAQLVQDETTPLPDFENPFAEGKTLPRWVLRDELQRRFAEDGALARIAQEVELKSHPDLLMVLLPGVDRISHYIWGVLEPTEKYPPGLHPTPEGREGGREALFTYYEYADALVGVLAQDFGPDDLVIVLSDHGFEAGQALLRLSGVHEGEKAIDGILYARGPGIAPGTQVKNMSVNDVTPTVLAWMGLPAAADMDGRPAPFVQVPQLAPIPTYDVGELSFVDPGEVPSGVEDDIVEQLKSLGYIDEE